MKKHLEPHELFTLHQHSYSADDKGFSNMMAYCLSHRDENAFLWLMNHKKWESSLKHLYISNLLLENIFFRFDDNILVIDSENSRLTKYPDEFKIMQNVKKTNDDKQGVTLFAEDSFTHLVLNSCINYLTQQFSEGRKIVFDNPHRTTTSFFNLALHKNFMPYLEWFCQAYPTMFNISNHFKALDRYPLEDVLSSAISGSAEDLKTTHTRSICKEAQQFILERCGTTIFSKDFHLAVHVKHDNNIFVSSLAKDIKTLKKMELYRYAWVFNQNDKLIPMIQLCIPKESKNAFFVHYILTNHPQYELYSNFILNKNDNKNSDATNVKIWPRFSEQAYFGTILKKYLSVHTFMTEEIQKKTLQLIQCIDPKNAIQHYHKMYEHFKKAIKNYKSLYKIRDRIKNILDITGNLPKHLKKNPELIQIWNALLQIFADCYPEVIHQHINTVGKRHFPEMKDSIITYGDFKLSWQDEFEKAILTNNFDRLNLMRKYFKKSNEALWRSLDRQQWYGYPVYNKTSNGISKLLTDIKTCQLAFEHVPCTSIMGNLIELALWHSECKTQIQSKIIDTVTYLYELLQTSFRNKSSVAFFSKKRSFFADVILRSEGILYFTYLRGGLTIDIKNPVEVRQFLYDFTRRIKQRFRKVAFQWLSLFWHSLSENEQTNTLLSDIIHNLSDVSTDNITLLLPSILSRFSAHEQSFVVTALLTPYKSYWQSQSWLSLNEDYFKNMDKSSLSNILKKCVVELNHNFDDMNTQKLFSKNYIIPDYIKHKNWLMFKNRQIEIFIHWCDMSTLKAEDIQLVDNYLSRIPNDSVLYPIVLKHIFNATKDILNNNSKDPSLTPLLIKSFLKGMQDKKKSGDLSNKTIPSKKTSLNRPKR